MLVRSETYPLEEKYIAKPSLTYFKLLMTCTIAVQQKFRSIPTLLCNLVQHLLLFIE